MHSSKASLSDTPVAAGRPPCSNGLRQSCIHFEMISLLSVHSRIDAPFTAFPSILDISHPIVSIRFVSSFLSVHPHPKCFHMTSSKAFLARPRYRLSSPFKTPVSSSNDSVRFTPCCPSASVSVPKYVVVIGRDSPCRFHHRTHSLARFHSKTHLFFGVASFHVLSNDLLL